MNQMTASATTNANLLYLNILLTILNPSLAREKLFVNMGFHIFYLDFLTSFPLQGELWEKVAVLDSLYFIVCPTEYPGWLESQNQDHHTHTNRLLIARPQKECPKCFDQTEDQSADQGTVDITQPAQYAHHERS